MKYLALFALLSLSACDTHTNSYRNSPTYQRVLKGCVENIPINAQYYQSAVDSCVEAAYFASVGAPRS